MSDIKKSIAHIAALEELAQLNSPIHRLQPSVKLIFTVIYLVMIISYPPGSISGLLPFLFFQVVVMTLGDIPIKPILSRLLFALPFPLFTGISNVILSREIVFYIGDFGITDGVISLTSILLKTILTVTAVLLLIATTNLYDLIYTLIQLKIPSVIAIQLMMTYRYISVLLNEISVMYHAYRLRAPKEKGIKLKDMGPFLGQLIIRSFDRSERIYQAMKCRGFDGTVAYSRRSNVKKVDILFLIIMVSILVMLRFVNISEVIGNLFL
ncbi:MAG: cbiQ2 [Anaerocolumna sp.]|jgi:cobalt/nickel transport system permease protein|nr:cbiQ2 [Anaerocolumna sp.]